ncbi:MAG: adenosylmethionine--8-amino-7-oxononanoate transaminase [Verrucomicrobia bacterium]|nr:adenosylmethionine--8-amino-7-oxononanoate transaminase [Verrucomicrobiota bacterium]
MDYIWHPYTKHSDAERGDLPVMVRGEGVYLFDAEGRGYVDLTSSWWSCALGHSHPRITAAIKRQADLLHHSILGNMSHEPALELAEMIVKLMPDDRRHVHFASDGASAVEAALKIAIQYWQNRKVEGRMKFASLREAYHGDTLGTVSLGYIEAFHHPFRDVLNRAFSIPVPPYDSSPDDALAQARHLFEESGHELAALVVEPLCQGAAGMRIYSADFLRSLDSMCREYGVLLIADEIATGFGRTGKMFAFEYAGIDPDIVCLGKALSAGALPISATVVKDSIYETFSDAGDDHTFYHGHTFAGNPLACAAAIEAQKIYAEESIAAKAAILGSMMQERVMPLEAAEAVGNVRCLGMIAAIELAGEGASADARRIRDELLKKGYLIRPLGPVIYLMPPLNTPPEILEEAIGDLKSAI